MATARLRRTFAYPTDDSSNGGTPEVLDEEEQETLIQALSDQNATTNQQYQLALLAVPILAAIPYLLALFRPPTFLIATLGLSSLASTAFLLVSLPPTETGIPLLDAWARAGDMSSSSSNSTTRPSSAVSSSGDDEQEGESSSSRGGGAGGGLLSGLGTLDRQRRRRRRSIRKRASHNSNIPSAYEVPKGPLERHLPFLNMGLCAILILFGLSAARAESQETGSNGGDHHDAHPNHHNFGWLGLGNLPTIVYVVTIVAKVVMASVDPERELAALRYGYKGA